MASILAPDPSPANSTLEAEWQKSLMEDNHAVNELPHIADFTVDFDGTQLSASLHETPSPGPDIVSHQESMAGLTAGPYFLWNEPSTPLSSGVPAPRTYPAFDMHRRSVSEPPEQLAHQDRIFDARTRPVTFHRNGQHLGEPRQPKPRATKSDRKEESGQHPSRFETNRGLRGFRAPRHSGMQFVRHPTSTPVQRFQPYPEPRRSCSPYDPTTYEYTDEPLQNQIVRPSTRVCTPQSQIDPQLMAFSPALPQAPRSMSAAGKPSIMVSVTPEELKALIRDAVDKAMERYRPKDESTTGTQLGSMAGTGSNASEDAGMDQLVDFDGPVKAENRT